MMSAGFSLGTMEAAIAKTAAHAAATKFEHLGQTLADQPTTRAHIARMRVKADMVRGLLLDALAALESGREDAMLRILEVKAGAGEASTEVTDLAMRVCGGAAFRKEVGVERHFRDARAVRLAPADVEHPYDAGMLPFLAVPTGQRVEYRLCLGEGHDLSRGRLREQLRGSA